MKRIESKWKRKVNIRIDRKEEDLHPPNQMMRKKIRFSTLFLSLDQLSRNHPQVELIEIVTLLELEIELGLELELDIE